MGMTRTGSGGLGNSLNSPRCLNRLMSAIACACAALPQWCRPRHQRPRWSAPTADTVGAPDTFGISAWLLRSEARRHLRCREERTGRGPHRDRQHSDASPNPRRYVSAGEGLGSCYSSGLPPFLPVGLRLWRCHAWLSKDFARLGACHHCERPYSSPASRTSRTPASCNAHRRVKLVRRLDLPTCTALRRVAEDPADAPRRQFRLRQESGCRAFGDQLGIVRFGRC